MVEFSSIAIPHQVQEMEEKLRKLQEGTILVKPEDRKAIEDKYLEKINQWRKRKRIFKDLWDSITENIPKDVKDFKVDHQCSILYQLNCS